MDVRTTCVALRTIKYKDNRAILSCLSRELGRLSLSVPDGKGMESQRRRALMMPGSIFGCVMDLSEHRDVQRPREMWGVRPLLLSDPAKGPVALFACDFLNSLIRDAQPDTRLFDYVDFALATLAATDAIGNYPIAFLTGLQRFMGIEPYATEYSRGMVFDLADGLFRQSPPLHHHFLDPDETAVAAQLTRMDFTNMHAFRFTQQQRRRILDVLLEYYSLHFGHLRGLNSLEVVRAVFE